MLTALAIVALLCAAVLAADPNRLARTVVNRGSPAVVALNSTQSDVVLTFVVDVCEGDVAWRVEELDLSTSAAKTIFRSASAAQSDARFDTLVQASPTTYRVTFETTADAARAVVELRTIDDTTRALLPPTWSDAAWFDPAAATINGLAAVHGATALYCAFGRAVPIARNETLATFESTCDALDALTVDHSLGECVTVASGAPDAAIAINRTLVPSLAANQLLRIDLLVTLSLPSASHLQQTHVLHPILVAPAVAPALLPPAPFSIVQLVTESGDRVAAIILGILAAALAVAVIVLCVLRRRSIARA